jgi:hypothetical protein
MQRDVQRTAATAQAIAHVPYSQSTHSLFTIAAQCCSVPLHCCSRLQAAMQRASLCMLYVTL